LQISGAELGPGDADRTLADALVTSNSGARRVSVGSFGACAPG